MVTEIVNIKSEKITQIFNYTSLHKAIQIIKITITIFENAIKLHFITPQSEK